LLLTLACLAGACGQRADAPSLGAVGALNDTLRVLLPSALDPTSVTPSSVQLRDARGRVLDWRAECRGRELRLDVVLGAEELVAADDGWRLRLAGFPSPHALRWLGGGQLAAGWSADVRPAPRLEPGRSATPRVLSVNGAPPGVEASTPAGTPLRLLLDGVFAPADLRPEQFPLRPTRGGLQLEPVFAQPSAQVVGGHTELQLALPRGSATLLLRTREWECRDVAGRRLDPSVVIRLSTH